MLIRSGSPGGAFALRAPSRLQRVAEEKAEKERKSVSPSSLAAIVHNTIKSGAEYQRSNSLPTPSLYCWWSASTSISSSRWSVGARRVALDSFLISLPYVSTKGQESARVLTSAVVGRGFPTRWSTVRSTHRSVGENCTGGIRGCLNLGPTHLHSLLQQDADGSDRLRPDRLRNQPTGWGLR